MKTALAITLAIPHKHFFGYVELAKTMVKSVLYHNKEINFDFYIYTDFSILPEWRQEFYDIYDKLIFWDVDRELYVKNSKTNIKFYSIESFNIPVNKVIYTGADVINLKSLDELLKVNCPIGMPKEKRRNTQFSNGVMVIGNEYINEKTYFKLLKYDMNKAKEYFGTDMRLYNGFFKGKITEIEHKYDVVTTEYEFYKDIHEITFLHYIHKTNASRNVAKHIDLWKFYRDLKISRKKGVTTIGS